MALTKSPATSHAHNASTRRILAFKATEAKAFFRKGEGEGEGEGGREIAREEERLAEQGSRRTSVVADLFSLTVSQQRLRWKPFDHEARRWLAWWLNPLD